MARYALRNQKKIQTYYNEKILKRIIKSLNEYFAEPDNIKEDVHILKGDKYPTLFINDAGHTCAIIAFYITAINYNVYRLAFKEFIG